MYNTYNSVINTCTPSEKVGVINFNAEGLNVQHENKGITLPLILLYSSFCTDACTMYAHVHVITVYTSRRCIHVHVCACVLTVTVFK